jgi:hypothetical protein
MNKSLSLIEEEEAAEESYEERSKGACGSHFRMGSGGSCYTQKIVIEDTLKDVSSLMNSPGIDHL